MKSCPLPAPPAPDSRSPGRFRSWPGGDESCGRCWRGEVARADWAISECSGFFQRKNECSGSLRRSRNGSIIGGFILRTRSPTRKTCWDRFGGRREISEIRRIRLRASSEPACSGYLLPTETWLCSQWNDTFRLQSLRPAEPGISSHLEVRRALTVDARLRNEKRS